MLEYSTDFASNFILAFQFQTFDFASVSFFFKSPLKKKKGEKKQKISHYISIVIHARHVCNSLIAIHRMDDENSIKGKRLHSIELNVPKN